MSAELVIASLLRVAKQDLDGARVLATVENRNAVYLCEQAAEKIIRAVLTSEGVHAGARHQLDEMVSAVPDANPLKRELRAVEHLAAYATSYRYPTPTGRIKRAPGRQDIDAIVARLEALLDDLTARFGVALGSEAPAARATPIR